MADVKFTGLAAASGIPDNGSIMAISTYDGAATYTSEKYTMTQLKDIVYVMESGDSITLPSANYTDFITQNGSNASLQMDSSDNAWFFTSDNGAEAEGALYVGTSVSYLNGAGSDCFISVSAAGAALLRGSSKVEIQHGTTNRIEVNGTGIGFFEATPVAKPTGVAVNATAIHAALVSLGLIGV